MASKVTFDSAQKLIICKAGTRLLDVQTDLYSAAKGEWLSDPVLNRFRFPISAIGGQPLPGGQTAGRTFFLNFGWKIRPDEADHELIIRGNLYTSDGSAAIIPTLGNYTVLVSLERSSLPQGIGSGLTGEQVTMLLEMYRILGLDPTIPLVVSDTQRRFGDVSQTISEDGQTGEVTITRDP